MQVPHFGANHDRYTSICRCRVRSRKKKGGSVGVIMEERAGKNTAMVQAVEDEKNKQDIARDNPNGKNH